MKKNLKTKDLISIGIYAAIYFGIVCLATLISALVFVGFNSIVVAGISALLSGLVYHIVLHKVNKFGAITVMGTVMGLFFLISGHFALAFIPCFACALLADYISSRGKYENGVLNFLGYILFSFGLTGPVLPLFFMKDAYVASLVNRGKDAAYIEKTFANINSITLVLVIVLTVIGAIAGYFFGQYLYKKHFSNQETINAL